MSRNYLILGVFSDIGIELVKKITKREKSNDYMGSLFFE